MTGHPDVESLASYALDALSPDETRALAAHLATCSPCRADLREWRDVTASLATLSPKAVAPQGMRARVLKRATGVGAQHSSEKAALKLRPRIVQTARWPLYAAAASAVVVLGLAGAAFNLRADRDTLAAQLATATTLAEDLELGLAARDSLLERVLGPDVQIATLAATGAAPSLRLYWDRSRGEMVVSAKRLPPPPEGRTYQLWGIGANASPVGLGTFNTEADGSAVVVLAVGNTGQFDVSAVTVEPVPGSAGPTSAPILVGRWPSDPIQLRD